VTLKEGNRSSKQLSPWIAKESKKHRASLDLNNDNSGRPRKDHWVSTRDHFLNFNQLDEDMDDTHQQLGHSVTSSEKGKETNIERRRQRRRRDADGNSGSNITDSQTKTSLMIDDSKKKAPPKKLSLQSGDKVKSRSSKDSAKKTMTRTSVTRSEIQEYWMQGYEYVQRTDKTTANIEQWQSAAMKSLEEKKINNARWSEIWRQQKDQQQLDDAKPCSSKMLESLDFA
jgi:hypothetical protein